MLATLNMGTPVPVSLVIWGRGSPISLGLWGPGVPRTLVIWGPFSDLGTPKVCVLYSIRKDM